MTQGEDGTEQPQLTAAERAMASVDKALDAFFRGEANAYDTVSAMARISGVYGMERIA